jgi:hypothetical protein
MPNVADPHDFGPPGSGSVSQSYGSFYHQAKLVRKTSVPTVSWFLNDLLSLKNDVNVPPKSNKQKILSGSVPKCHGSATLLVPICI